MAIENIATDKNFNYEKSYSNAWLYKIIINITCTNKNFNLNPPEKHYLKKILHYKKKQVKEKKGLF